MAKYAQDPNFQPSDKEFLKKLGIEAIDTPKCFDLVDGETFMYCPDLPFEVSDHLCRGVHPALYMGNTADAHL